jgi:ABC-type antimicrobial peptide transport system permease subunit
MPQVEAVSGAILGFISSEELPLFIVTGLDPNSPAMSHYAVVEGRAIRRPMEVILGRNAAEIYDLGVGDTIQLYDNRYRIVGIYETGITYEEGGGLLALQEAQRLLERGRTVSFIFVDVHDPAQAEAVKAAIDRRFPEARASLSSEFAQNTNDIQSTMAIATAIRMLALIVGGIVVTNTMIMSIYERTREIGTLRALGWSRLRILGQIMQESLYLCLLAALLGSIFGVLLLTLVSWIPAASQFVDPRWSLATFGVAVGVAVGLGLLGGFYPAWRASCLRPVEALRYE